MQGLEHSKTENKCKDLPIKLQRSLRNIRTPYVFLQVLLFPAHFISALRPLFCWPERLFLPK